MSQRLSHFQHLCDLANQKLDDKRFILERISKGYLITDNDKGTSSEVPTLDGVLGTDEYYTLFFVLRGAPLIFCAP